MTKGKERRVRGWRRRGRRGVIFIPRGGGEVEWDMRDFADVVFETELPHMVMG